MNETNIVPILSAGNTGVRMYKVSVILRDLSSVILYKLQISEEPASALIRDNLTPIKFRNRENSISLDKNLDRIYDY